MSRKVYLEDIPLGEAWRRFSAALKAIGRWQPIEGEDIPVPEALGRVTARPIWAQVSSPAYHASAMDGYAVRAEETITANDTHPLQLELGPQAQYVDTGDPLPGWADAVIMIEHVQPIGARTLRFVRRSRRGRLYGRWAKTWWRRNSYCLRIMSCARSIWARWRAVDTPP